MERPDRCERLDLFDLLKDSAPSCERPDAFDLHRVVGCYKVTGAPSVQSRALGDQTKCVGLARTRQRVQRRRRRREAGG